MPGCGCHIFAIGSVMYSNPSRQPGCDVAPGDAQLHRTFSATLVGRPKGPTPRLVILGSPDISLREQITVHLDPALLDRLEAVASGSHSLLIEMALRSMVEQLEEIDRQGGDGQDTECVMVQASQLDDLVLLSN